MEPPVGLVPERQPEAWALGPTGVRPALPFGGVFCDLLAALSLSGRSLGGSPAVGCFGGLSGSQRGCPPWWGRRAHVGTYWDWTRVPPSHPPLHLSTVFVGCQLLSAHSGRAARGLCSAPLCAKQSTFTAELTGSSEQQGRRGSQGVKANSRK